MQVATAVSGKNRICMIQSSMLLTCSFSFWAWCFMPGCQSSPLLATGEGCSCHSHRGNRHTVSIFLAHIEWSRKSLFVSIVLGYSDQKTFNVWQRRKHHNKRNREISSYAQTHVINHFLKYISQPKKE